MTRQEIFDNIETVLAQLSDDDLIDIWNIYKRSINDYDNIIHEMSDLDIELKGYKPTEILQTCHEIYYDDDYYYWSYNVRVSFNDIYQIYDEYELINAMIDNRDSYGVCGVDYILEDLESETKTMLKTKTKKELKEIKDMGLYDDLCELSDLLYIDYVSSYYGTYVCGKTDIFQVYVRPSQAKINSFNILRKLYYLNDKIKVIKALSIKCHNCHKYVTNIVIEYNGHEYLIIDTADYRYLYLY